MSTNENIWIVVQARLGSHRLKNKMLLHFKGLPIINWSLQRLLKCKRVQGVALAIPDCEIDFEVFSQTVPSEIKILKGSPDDLCERYLSVSNVLNCTQIIRVCADNPLVCPEIVDELVDFHLDNQLDYSWNHIPYLNQFPDGLGAEITNVQTLKWINENASGDQREHLFNVLKENPDGFKLGTYNPYDSSLARPELKFDIDTWEDFLNLNRFDFDINMDASQLIQQVDLTKSDI